MVAPGQPLRDGLDRILRAKRGGLVVLGDGPDVLSICSGGFLLDSEFSPQRLSELAKMDGAIIVAPDGSRSPGPTSTSCRDATIPTSETGTRHRTARAGGPVDRRTCPVGLGGHVGHRRLPERPQAHRAAHRVAPRPDGPGAGHHAALPEPVRRGPREPLHLEVEDTVSVGDVVHVIRRRKWSCGSARRSTATWSSWARTARLVASSRPSWSTAWPGPSTWWSVTTASCRPRRRADRTALEEWVVEQLANLTSDELRNPNRVASILRLPGAFHDAESGIEPPRLSPAAPPAASVRHHHRTDRRPVRQSAADHAGLAVRPGEGGGRRTDPGPPRSRTVWPGWPRPASSSATSRTCRAVRVGSTPRGRGPSRGLVEWLAPQQTGCRSPAPVPPRNTRRNGVRHR